MGGQHAQIRKSIPASETASAKALKPNAFKLLRKRKKVSMAEWCEPLAEQKEVSLEQVWGLCEPP